MRIPPTIRVDLDDIVASVGDQLVANRLLEPARNLLDQMGQQLASLPDHLRDVIPCAVEASVGEGPRREAEAWSRLIGRPWREILIANCNYDLFMAGGLTPLLCSVLILPTPQGPVFGRNLDWHPRNELASASCRLEYSRGGRKLFEAAGWPGAIGAVTGLSHNGFGLALNYPCGSGCDFNPKGWPVLLLIRSLLEEAGSYAEALERLRRQKITCPGLFTLAGGSNTEMAVVEHQGDDARVHPPKAPRGVRVPRIVATNHFGGEDGFCVRYQRLAGEAFRDLEPESPVSDGEIFRVLESVMLPDMTANHVVMRPRDRRMELRVPAEVTGR